MTKYIYRIVPVPSTPISFNIERAEGIYDEVGTMTFDNWQRLDTCSSKKQAEDRIWSKIKYQEEFEEFKKNNPPYIYPPE